jgi:hypothetical protein
MTHREFFDALRALAPLRVISVSGPSVFEAICGFGPYGVADGHLNAITDAYHWHLDLSRFRILTSRDETHARSGRRVLFFELREAAGAEPFLLVYLHRAKGEDFAPAREERFAGLHARLGRGEEMHS